VVDHRARRGFPEHWLLPPAPREPALRDRWHARGFADRRRLARVHSDQVAELSEDDRALVAALQHARLATRWRLLAAAPVLGWLVLMTVWGLGRSAYPQAEQAWLLSAIALGAATWFVAALAAATRLRRARAVLAATEPSAGSEQRRPSE